MFAADPRTAHTPHNLARSAQPPLPPDNSISLAPNLPAQHSGSKTMAASQPAKPRAPHANTSSKSSRFLSPPCALFPRSFSQEGKSTPLFSIACAQFCRNGRCAPSRKISRPHSMICELRKTPKTEKSAKNSPTNCPTARETNRSTTDAATARLCYCLRSPAHRCAACTTHHKKTNSRCQLS